jgi:hypothetical protein
LKSLSGIWRSGKYQQPASTPVVLAAAADGAFYTAPANSAARPAADEYLYAGSSFTMADEFIWNR